MRNICKMLAQITVSLDQFEDNKIVSISDPTIGAGAFMIALCDHLDKKNINYPEQLKIVGQDSHSSCKLLYVLKPQLPGGTMKIIGNCILFYSIPENFIKEKHGSKPNTVRILDRKDERAVQAARNNLKRILITDTHTGQSFERQLTDITNFEYTHEDIEIWIFSWKNYKLIDD